jgi:hypothetical protein
MVQGFRMSLGEALLEAYELIWEMYDNSLERIPEEHWRVGENRPFDSRKTGLPRCRDS